MNSAYPGEVSSGMQIDLAEYKKMRKRTQDKGNEWNGDTQDCARHHHPTMAEEFEEVLKELP